MSLDLDAYAAHAAKQKAALLADPAYAGALRDVSLGGAAAATVEDAYDQLVAEGACTLRLIEPALPPPRAGWRLLEVGGGVGFAHLWLRLKGYDVTSLEPSEGGHDGAFRAGKALLAHFNLTDGAWLSLAAADAPLLGRTFDLVFSNNVLEHVEDLDGAMAKLAAVLAPGGVMRHNCPNYAVPYEPHFGLPLVPFAPRVTARLVPRLARDALWQGLNFVTAGTLRRLARRNALRIEFDRDHFYRTFLRLGREAAFAAKHPGLATLFRVLKACRALGLLRRIPPGLVTPMQTTWRRS